MAIDAAAAAASGGSGGGGSTPEKFGLPFGVREGDKLVRPKRLPGSPWTWNTVKIEQGYRHTGLRCIESRHDGFRHRNSLNTQMLNWLYDGPLDMG
jgi:hypothetical protein